MRLLLNDKKLFFRQTLLIAGQDFKRLVLSPLFFFWAGISFILLSYNFPRDLFRFASSYALSGFGQPPGQEGNIHFEVFVGHISYINLLFLMTVPIFAMRLLAEEKRNHTFDLLMTSPVSSLQLILGKYLSLLAVILLFLAFSLVYPLSTGFFADLPFRLLLISYLGLFLLALTYCSAGLFASSLTQSLFLSAFIGVILNISFWFLSPPGQAFASPLLTDIMSYLSLVQHLGNFIKGSLAINSLVFFFSLIALFLFLALKTVEMARWRH